MFVLNNTSTINYLSYLYNDLIWFVFSLFSSNEDIIQLIRDGDHDDIGAEKLRGLLKILPELDELEMLRAFEGDKTKLGNAEKFLLQLIDIPK